MEGMINPMAEKMYSRKELEEFVTKATEQYKSQNEMLIRKCQYFQEQVLFKRLDYLFKVVENYNRFPAEFVDKCVKEIVNGMTLPETESVQEDSQKSE